MGIIKMKVFQDVFTNDEIMSDVFDFSLSHEDVIMKVQSKLINKAGMGNIDVGCGNAFGGGEDEGADDMAEEKVLDVEYNHNLIKTPFSKGDFMALIKPFLKNLKAHLTANGNKIESRNSWPVPKLSLKKLLENLMNGNFI